MKLKKLRFLLPAAVLVIASLGAITTHAEVSQPARSAAHTALTPSQIEKLKQRATAQLEQFQRKQKEAMDAAHALTASKSPKATSSQVMRIIAGELPNPAGVPLADLQLTQPAGVVVDSSGNAYVADSALCVILKITPSGTISLFAGSGACGYEGDGGQGSAAETGYIIGLAINSGYLYFGDNSSHVVRKVSLSTGVISRVAGTPNVAGEAGDGGAATAATLGAIFQIAFDSANNLYIADATYGLVREVLAASGNITTVAGINTANGATECSSGGTDGFGDGCLATQAYIYPYGVLVSGNTLYIGDGGVAAIRAVNLTTGIITVFAGTVGNAGDTGDGGAATSAEVGLPSSLVMDASGNLYFSDAQFDVIRKITSGGTISTVAGTAGVYGYGGDGGPAMDAEFEFGGQTQITLAGTTLLVADLGNGRVRQIVNVANGGTITTLAGNGYSNYYGNGQIATLAGLANPVQTAEDTAGNLYIADSSNYAVRKVNAVTGIISTVAGTGLSSGTGVPGDAATTVPIEPDMLVVDSAGNLYLADGLTQTIMKVTASTGILLSITTAATDYRFNQFGNMALDAAQQNLYVPAGNQVAEVNLASGTVTVIANTANTQGFSGDGTAATGAELNNPSGVALDGLGNLYVADNGNSRVREINLSTGIINTVAGDGTYGASGDNGPAIDAGLGQINGVAFDPSGNYYLPDSQDALVRKVTVSTGIISTVVGTGVEGYNGGGLAPLSTQLSPDAVTVDSAGNLLISDFGNELVWFDTTLPQPVTNTLTSSETNVPPGSSVTLTSTLTGPNFFGKYPSGSVAFKSGSSTLATATLSKGVATLTASSSGLPVGSYSITAAYAGDSTYAAANSAPLTLTVKYGSTTTETASPTSLTVGTPLVLSATVKAATGSGVPTGMVTFTSNGTTLGSLTLSGGTGSVSLPTSSYAPGTYSIVANYSGDGNYAASSSAATSVAVKTTSTTKLVASPTTLQVGQTLTLTATVTPATGSGIPTGTVSFSSAGTSLGTATLSSGTAVLTYATTGLTPGTYSIVASYAGDTNDAPSTSSAASVGVTAAPTTTTFTLTPSTIAVGGTTVLKAVVARTSGSGTPTGSVTFSSGSTNITTTTLTNGVATFSAPTTGYPAGSYTLTAKYNPDSSDTTSSANATLKIIPATKTVLAISPNPVSQGTNTVFTITVSPSTGSGATPAGSVSIYINGQLFSTSTLNGSGQLVVTEPTGSDPKANYTVYATYAGSSTYGASTSNTVTLTIQ